MKKRRIIVVLAVVVMIGALSSLAYADNRNVEGHADQHNEGADISGSHHNGSDSAQSGSSSAPRTGGTTIDPDTKRCQDLARTGSGIDVAKFQECMTMMDNSVGTPNLYPVAPNVVPPQVVAERTATDFVKHIALPKPNPKMGAPSGMCGVPHQMLLDTAPVFSPPVHETDMGTLRVTAKAIFDIDWGDGIKASYSPTGTDWPRNDIMHTWITRGTYTISVTATWTLQWQLAEFGGTIPSLRTTTTIPNWQVYEAQAVVVG